MLVEMVVAVEMMMNQKAQMVGQVVEHHLQVQMVAVVEEIQLVVMVKVGLLEVQ